MPSGSLHVQSGPAAGPRDAIPLACHPTLPEAGRPCQQYCSTTSAPFLSDRHLGRLAAESLAFYNSPQCFSPRLVLSCCDDVDFGRDDGAGTRERAKHPSRDNEKGLETMKRAVVLYRRSNQASPQAATSADSTSFQAD